MWRSLWNVVTRKPEEMADHEENDPQMEDENQGEEGNNIIEDDGSNVNIPAPQQPHPEVVVPLAQIVEPLKELFAPFMQHIAQPVQAPIVQVLPSPPVLRFNDFKPPDTDPKTWIKVARAALSTWKDLAKRDVTNTELLAAIGSSMHEKASAWFGTIFSNDLDWARFEQLFDLEFCQSDTAAAAVYRSLTAQPENGDTAKLVTEQIVKLKEAFAGKSTDTCAVLCGTALAAKFEPLIRHWAITEDNVTEPNLIKQLKAVKVMPKGAKVTGQIVPYGNHCPQGRGFHSQSRPQGQKRPTPFGQRGPQPFKQARFQGPKGPRSDSKPSTSEAQPQQNQQQQQQQQKKKRPFCTKCRKQGHDWSRCFRNPNRQGGQGQPAASDNSQPTQDRRVQICTTAPASQLEHQDESHQVSTAALSPTMWGAESDACPEFVSESESSDASLSPLAPLGSPEPDDSALDLPLDSPLKGPALPPAAPPLADMRIDGKGECRKKGGESSDSGKESDEDNKMEDYEGGDEGEDEYEESEGDYQDCEGFDDLNYSWNCYLTTIEEEEEEEAEPETEEMLIEEEDSGNDSDLEKSELETFEMLEKLCEIESKERGEKAERGRIQSYHEYKKLKETAPIKVEYKNQIVVEKDVKGVKIKPAGLDEPCPSLGSQCVNSERSGQKGENVKCSGSAKKNLNGRFEEVSENVSEDVPEIRVACEFDDGVGPLREEGAMREFVKLEERSREFSDESGESLGNSRSVECLEQFEDYSKQYCADGYEDDDQESVLEIQVPVDFDSEDIPSPWWVRKSDLRAFKAPKSFFDKTEPESSFEEYGNSFEREDSGESKNKQSRYSFDTSRFDCGGSRNVLSSFDEEGNVFDGGSKIAKSKSSFAGDIEYSNDVSKSVDDSRCFGEESKSAGSSFFERKGCENSSADSSFFENEASERDSGSVSAPKPAAVHSKAACGSDTLTRGPVDSNKGGPSPEGSIPRDLRSGGAPLINRRSPPVTLRPPMKHDPDTKIKSALKRASSKKRKKHKVQFDESLNKFFEADYVILIREECGGGGCDCGGGDYCYAEDEDEDDLDSRAHLDSRASLTQVQALDLTPFDPPVEFVDQLTLSPPDGYKDHCLHHCSDDDKGVERWPPEEPKCEDGTTQTTPTSETEDNDGSLSISEVPDKKERYIVETITMTTVTERRIIREAEEAAGAGVLPHKDAPPQLHKQDKEMTLTFKLNSNSLKPNSALRQLFPRIASPPPDKSPDSDDDSLQSNLIKRTIERNTLRRSLVRYPDIRKRAQAKKNENSLVERIKKLTCDIDDDEAPTPPARGSPTGEESQDPLHESAVHESTTTSTTTVVETSKVPAYRKITDIFIRNKEPQPVVLQAPSSVEHQYPYYQPYNPPDLGNGLPKARAGNEARKQFLSSLAPLTACVSGVDDVPGSRDSTSTVDTDYSLGDIDDVLKVRAKDIYVSNVMTSARPMTTRSTSVALMQPNQDQKPQPDIVVGTPGNESDELALFVQQDASRIERLRKRYSSAGGSDDEQDDYGFNRRPSVRGIKPRFGSTTEILQQMQSQITPPLPSGSHVSWPYYPPDDRNGYRRYVDEPHYSQNVIHVQQGQSVRVPYPAGPVQVHLMNGPQSRQVVVRGTQTISTYYQIPRPALEQFPRGPLVYYPRSPVCGSPTKMKLERGVPEGASASPHQEQALLPPPPGPPASVPPGPPVPAQTLPVTDPPLMYAMNV